MKVRGHVAMILNLDKCIGCHTCSITCKNVWTTRPGMEYAWWNNVETKPGLGYPRQWEDQSVWNGGWERRADGALHPKQGSRWRILSKIFSNPHLPQIDDYYDPVSYDYQHLQSAPASSVPPVARPLSAITGETKDTVTGGPNWDDDLGGEFQRRKQDIDFGDLDREALAEFENTFLFYLPRLCEHCMNPTCVASCPSGSIYKREEDGIVLVDQDKCRGWRMCVSGCPYKKVYFNWQSGKAEKCVFCYPRIESGQPTVCADTCVGKLRYIGVVLYDADRIAEAAAVPDVKDLYEAQLGVFLDPHDPAVQAQARQDGVPDNWIDAAGRSPIHKLAVEYRVAFPLHPEYRTLPMVWYLPPLSPVRSPATEQDGQAQIPDTGSMRIPTRYLANLLTAGKEEPIVGALDRIIAMRRYMRTREIQGEGDGSLLSAVGLTETQALDLYRYLAIANIEDIYVIPTTHRETADESFLEQGSCGFTSSLHPAEGATGVTAFGGKQDLNVQFIPMDQIGRPPRRP